MQEKPIQHSDTWTNVVFLIPLFVSLYFGLFYFSILIALSTISSFFYHYSDEKQFHLIDRVLAYAIMVSNAVLIYKGNFEPRSFLYAFLVFAVLAVYFYYSDEDGKNEIRHSFWHFFASFITVFCILMFVL